MISNWQNIFNKFYKFNYAYELLYIGNNYIAHPTEKSDKEWNNENIGERALDTLFRLMHPINIDAANQISDIKHCFHDKKSDQKTKINITSGTIKTAKKQVNIKDSTQ